MMLYDEVVEFIANASPQAVADFQASDRTKARAAELLRRGKTNGLTSEEKAELDYFEMLEEIMGLAKARARQIVAHGGGD